MVKQLYFNTKKKLVGQVKEHLHMSLVLFLLSAQSQRVIIQGDQNISGILQFCILEHIGYFCTYNKIVPMKLFVMVREHNDIAETSQIGSRNTSD